MQIGEGLKNVAAQGVASMMFPAVGGAIGLVSGTLATFHEPGDGTADVKGPLMYIGAGAGAMALGSYAATRGGFLGASGGVVALVGGLVTVLGGVAAGHALAD